MVPGAGDARRKAARERSGLAELVALRDEAIQFVLLLGDAARGTLLIGGAGEGGGLLGELTDIVAQDGDPVVEFVTGQAGLVGHRHSPF